MRLYSGLILFMFVSGHFINHALGLISLELMLQASEIFIAPWQTLPGSTLLYGAFFIHAGVALYALFQRRTLKMPAWEAIQLIAGFLAPLMLAAHVAGTWGLSRSGFLPNYATTLNVFWNFAPLQPRSMYSGISPPGGAFCNPSPYVWSGHIPVSVCIIG